MIETIHKKEELFEIEILQIVLGKDFDPRKVERVFKLKEPLKYQLIYDGQLKGTITFEKDENKYKVTFDKTLKKTKL